MSPERWKELEEIYHAALPLAQRERAVFLARACAGDEQLRREAEMLLAADDAAAANFLQSGAFTLGMQALADGAMRRTKMNVIPKKIKDRYEILRELGGGGMGKVYQTRDTDVSNRLVVIKVLLEKWLQHDWVVTKFKQEAAVLAKLDDPGIVGIFDAGALPDGQPWLVMQFVEGVELKQHIERAAAGMDFADVAEIIKQIGRTLTTAHAAGVIHRDLKPANIMIRRNTSGDWQVKVIDFGIAKVLGSAQEATPATQFQVGTPLYMSPEQPSMQEVTSASDVYSLGLIAYEMLTGKRPFHAQTSGELAELQKHGLQEKASAQRAGLPGAVDDVLRTALHYDPAKRQHSARKFGDDLARALTPPPPGKFDWRIVAAVAAVVLIAVLAGLLWWGLSDPPLPSAEVVVVRPASQPTSGAITAPANPRIYAAEASFPTGKPPQGMVYATIGFTV